MLLKSTENAAGIARRLGCLECLGRLSWMLWESSGISEIARATNVRFLWFRTDDLTGRSVGLIRYDLMGIISCRGFPHGAGPLLYASGWPLMPSTSRGPPT